MRPTCMSGVRVRLPDSCPRWDFEISFWIKGCVQKKGQMGVRIQSAEVWRRSRTITCRTGADRCQRNCFQRHPLFLFTVQPVHTMALCWRQKTRVFGEPLDRRLSPFWPGPLLDPGSPRHMGVGWIDPAWVAASTVLPLFLPSLILVGPGFPCSGSQSSRTSSTANVSQFVQDHVGGDDPLGSSGRNPRTRLGLPHRPSYGSSNAEKPKALVLEIRTGPWEAQVERGPVSSWGEGMSCSHPPLGSQELSDEK
nr:uncharacterized protein LOC103888596 isoform X3 [Pongo abelii]XP_054396271.1 uncharacterized protein LOC103888596 isoform X3 [Pongo abelii]XP_054396272.1 uncharacterized protein LOC103888596 isoform X3 [Pongo abelii]